MWGGCGGGTGHTNAPHWISSNEANERDHGAIWLTHGRPIAQAPRTCKEILAKDSSASSGTYTINPGNNNNNKEISVVCDMDSDGGGWTQFLRHADHSGHTPVSVSKWDAGMQLAADGGITKWMIKTFGEPTESTKAGSAYLNAFTMTMAPAVQRESFVFFKHHAPTVCGVRRFEPGDS